MVAATSSWATKSAAEFRFGCVSFVVVEPSCSARCSSHVSHCIRSRSHLPCIPTCSKLKFLLFSVPTAMRSSHSHVNVMEFRFPIVIIRRFPSLPIGTDIVRFHPHKVPLQSSDASVGILHFSSHNIELLWVSLRPTQMGDARLLSGPCLLSRLRGHAHLCRCLTAFQPVPDCWLPILFVCGSVVSPICFPTSPSMHTSYRVTVVSAQEHNAFIGLLDHGDTCFGS